MVVQKQFDSGPLVSSIILFILLSEKSAQINVFKRIVVCKNKFKIME